MTSMRRPGWRSRHRALAHLADAVVHAAGGGRSAAPPRPDGSEGRVMVDRCQVVRYRATDEAAARALAEADAPRAARAGFVPDGPGRWVAGGPRSAVVVTYRYEPPPTITRSIETDAHAAHVVAAADAVAMADAGYVPAGQLWRGRSFGTVEGLMFGPAAAYGWSGEGHVIIEYRYDPALAGEPVCAVALTDGSGRTGWWVLDEATDRDRD